MTDIKIPQALKDSAQAVKDAAELLNTAILKASLDGLLVEVDVDSSQGRSRVEVEITKVITFQDEV